MALCVGWSGGWQGPLAEDARPSSQVVVPTRTTRFGVEEKERQHAQAKGTQDNEAWQRTRRARLPGMMLYLTSVFSAEE